MSAGLIALVAALSVFLFLAFLAQVFDAPGRRRQKANQRMRQRLAAGGPARTADDFSDVLRKEHRDRNPGLAERLQGLLSHFALFRNMRRLCEQANVSTPPALFLGMAFILLLVGYFGVRAYTGDPWLGVPIALVGWKLPSFLLHRKKNKRLKRFQHQFAEALDLIARALKAGHAFTAGLRMVADEMPDPVGPEFAQVLEEINYGLGMETALENLTRRVDCAEVMFFAVSVIIQRETGGNLSEIVSNISALVRERFRIQGNVKVFAAQGRLTAIILCVLPFAVAGIIWLINPGFMSVLFTDPRGHKLLKFALFQMGLGMLIIRKMCQIRI